jgi:alkylation response protein AidB-like acyl-CoA dehydrogenase
MFTQTADQELFEATTARFLDEHYPPARVRELAEQDVTFDATLWKRGAEFGWTTLLVPESAGGGSISGNGLADLLLVAFQFGRHAAPGPLFGTNAVAAALARWGSDEQRNGPLAALLDGGATASWAYPPTLEAVERGPDVVLNGTLPCVEGADDAACLLVRADDGGTRSHYLVPLPAPGIETAPLHTIDLTRRYQRVTFRDVTVPATARVGGLGDADAHNAVLLDITATLRAGEIVGAMARSFDITLQWTVDRYSFGRPLGSYQEIKHRVADMRTQLEASAAVAGKAARMVGEDAADAGSWASAAMAYAGATGPEMIQDCVQLHGGIGVTYEHDLHLYLRRAAVDAQLFGTPAHFRDRLTCLLEGSAR